MRINPTNFIGDYYNTTRFLSNPGDMSSLQQYIQGNSKGQQAQQQEILIDQLQKLEFKDLCLRIEDIILAGEKDFQNTLILTQKCNLISVFRDKFSVIVQYIQNNEYQDNSNDYQQKIQELQMGVVLYIKLHTLLEQYKNVIFGFKLDLESMFLQLQYIGQEQQKEVLKIGQIIDGVQGGMDFKCQILVLYIVYGRQYFYEDLYNQNNEFYDIFSQYFGKFLSEIQRKIMQMKEIKSLQIIQEILGESLEKDFKVENNAQNQFYLGIMVLMSNNYKLEQKFWNFYFLILDLGQKFYSEQSNDDNIVIGAEILLEMVEEYCHKVEFYDRNGRFQQIRVQNNRLKLKLNYGQKTQEFFEIYLENGILELSDLDWMLFNDEEQDQNMFGRIQEGQENYVLFRVKEVCQRIESKLVEDKNSSKNNSSENSQKKSEKMLSHVWEKFSGYFQKNKDKEQEQEEEDQEDKKKQYDEEEALQNIYNQKYMEQIKRWDELTDQQRKMLCKVVGIYIFYIKSKLESGQYIKQLQEVIQKLFQQQKFKNLIQNPDSFSLEKVQENNEFDNVFMQESSVQLFELLYKLSINGKNDHLLKNSYNVLYNLVFYIITNKQKKFQKQQYNKVVLIAGWILQQADNQLLMEHFVSKKIREVILDSPSSQNSVQEKIEFHQKILHIIFVKNYQVEKKGVYGLFPILEDSYGFMDEKRPLGVQLQNICVDSCKIQNCIQFLYRFLERLKYISQYKNFYKPFSDIVPDKCCNQHLESRDQYGGTPEGASMNCKICKQNQKEQKSFIFCSKCQKTCYCMGCAQVFQCRQCKRACNISEGRQSSYSCRTCRKTIQKNLPYITCNNCSEYYCFHCQVSLHLLGDKYDLAKSNYVCGKQSECNSNVTIEVNHRYWSCDFCRNTGEYHNFSHRGCDFDTCWPCYEKVVPAYQKYGKFSKGFGQQVQKYQKYSCYVKQVYSMYKESVCKYMVENLDDLSLMDMEMQLNFWADNFDYRDTSLVIKDRQYAYAQGYNRVYFQQLVGQKLQKFIDSKEFMESVFRVVKREDYFQVSQEIEDKIYQENDDDNSLQQLQDVQNYALFTQLLALIGYQNLQDFKMYALPDTNYFSKKEKDRAKQWEQELAKLYVNLYPKLMQFFIQAQQVLITPQRVQKLGSLLFRQNQEEAIITNDVCFSYYLGYSFSEFVWFFELCLYNVQQHLGLQSEQQKKYKQVLQQNGAKYVQFCYDQMVEFNQEQILSEQQQDQEELNTQIQIQVFMYYYLQIFRGPQMQNFEQSDYSQYVRFLQFARKDGQQDLFKKLLNNGNNNCEQEINQFLDYIFEGLQRLGQYLHKYFLQGNKFSMLIRRLQNINHAYFYSEIFSGKNQEWFKEDKNIQEKVLMIALEIMKIEWIGQLRNSSISEKITKLFQENSKDGSQIQFLIDKVFQCFSDKRISLKLIKFMISEVLQDEQFKQYKDMILLGLFNYCKKYMEANFQQKQQKVLFSDILTQGQKKLYENLEKESKENQEQKGLELKIEIDLQYFILFLEILDCQDNNNGNKDQQIYEFCYVENRSIIYQNIIENVIQEIMDILKMLQQQKLQDKEQQQYVNLNNVSYRASQINQIYGKISRLIGGCEDIQKAFNETRVFEIYMQNLKKIQELQSVIQHEFKDFYSKNIVLKMEPETHINFKSNRHGHVQFRITDIQYIESRDCVTVEFQKVSTSYLKSKRLLKNVYYEYQDCSVENSKFYNGSMDISKQNKWSFEENNMVVHKMEYKLSDSQKQQFSLKKSFYIKLVGQSNKIRVHAGLFPIKYVFDNVLKNLRLLMIRSFCLQVSYFQHQEQFEEKEFDRVIEIFGTQVYNNQYMNQQKYFGILLEKLMYQKLKEQEEQENFKNFVKGCIEINYKKLKIQSKNLKEDFREQMGCYLKFEQFGDVLVRMGLLTETLEDSNKSDLYTRFLSIQECPKVPKNVQKIVDILCENYQRNINQVVERKEEYFLDCGMCKDQIQKTMKEYPLVIPVFLEKELEFQGQKYGFIDYLVESLADSYMHNLDILKVLVEVPYYILEKVGHENMRSSCDYLKQQICEKILQKIRGILACYKDIKEQKGLYRLISYVYNYIQLFQKDEHGWKLQEIIMEFFQQEMQKLYKEEKKDARLQQENLNQFIEFLFDGKSFKYLKNIIYKKVENQLENCDNAKKYAYYYFWKNMQDWTSTKKIQKNEQIQLQCENIVSLQEYFDKYQNRIYKENDIFKEDIQQLQEKEELIQQLRGLQDKFQYLDYLCIQQEKQAQEQYVCQKQYHNLYNISQKELQRYLQQKNVLIWKQQQQLNKNNDKEEESQKVRVDDQEEKWRYMAELNCLGSQELMKQFYKKERLGKVLNQFINLVQEKLEVDSLFLQQLKLDQDESQKNQEDKEGENEEDNDDKDNESEQDLKENIMKMQQQKEFNDSENLKWMLYKLREYKVSENLENLNQEIPFGEKWQNGVLKLTEQEKRKLKDQVRKLGKEQKEDLLKRMDLEIVKSIDEGLAKEAVKLKKGVFPEFGEAQDGKQGFQTSRNFQRRRSYSDESYYDEEEDYYNERREESPEAQELREYIEELLDDGVPESELREDIAVYNRLVNGGTIADSNYVMDQEESQEGEDDILFSNFEVNESADQHLGNKEFFQQFPQLKDGVLTGIIVYLWKSSRSGLGSSNYKIMNTISMNPQNCYRIYDAVFFCLQLSQQDSQVLYENGNILGSKHEKLGEQEAINWKQAQVVSLFREKGLFNKGKEESCFGYLYGAAMIYRSLIYKLEKTVILDQNFQSQQLQIQEREEEFEPLEVVKEAREILKKRQQQKIQQQNKQQQGKYFLQLIQELWDYLGDGKFVLVQKYFTKIMKQIQIQKPQQQQSQIQLQQQQSQELGSFSSNKQKLMRKKSSISEINQCQQNLDQQNILDVLQNYTDKKKPIKNEDKIRYPDINLYSLFQQYPQNLQWVVGARFDKELSKVKQDLIKNQPKLLQFVCKELFREPVLEKLVKGQERFLRCLQKKEKQWQERENYSELNQQQYIDFFDQIQKVNNGSGKGESETNNNNNGRSQRGLFGDENDSDMRAVFNGDPFGEGSGEPQQQQQLQQSDNGGDNKNNDDDDDDDDISGGYLQGLDEVKTQVSFYQKVVGELVPEMLIKALKVEEIYNKEVEKAKLIKGKKIRQQNQIEKLKKQKKEKIKKINRVVQQFFSNKLEKQAPKLLDLFESQIEIFKLINSIAIKFNQSRRQENSAAHGKAIKSVLDNMQIFQKMFVLVKTNKSLRLQQQDSRLAQIFRKHLKSLSVFQRYYIANYFQSSDRDIIWKYELQENNGQVESYVKQNRVNKLTGLQFAKQLGKKHTFQNITIKHQEEIFTYSELLSLILYKYPPSQLANITFSVQSSNQNNANLTVAKQQQQLGEWRKHIYLQISQEKLGLFKQLKGENYKLLIQQQVKKNQSPTKKQQQKNKQQQQQNQQQLQQLKEFERVYIYPNQNSYLVPEDLQQYRFIGRYLGNCIGLQFNSYFEFQEVVVKLILGEKIYLEEFMEFDGELVKVFQEILAQKYTENNNNIPFKERVASKKVDEELLEFMEDLEEGNKREKIQQYMQYKYILPILEQTRAIRQGIVDILHSKYLQMFSSLDFKLSLFGNCAISLAKWKKIKSFDFEEMEAKVQEEEEDKKENQEYQDYIKLRRRFRTNLSNLQNSQYVVKALTGNYMSEIPENLYYNFKMCKNSSNVQIDVKNQEVTLGRQRLDEEDGSSPSDIDNVDYKEFLQKLVRDINMEENQKLEQRVVEKERNSLFIFQDKFNCSEDKNSNSNSNNGLISNELQE